MLKTTDGAFDAFSSLNPASIALLLDVDGTLLDIGPSPFDVHVPVTLVATLARLSALTSGALALVSGRPIRDLDTLFAPLKLPTIGGHGAELRLREGAPINRIGDLPEALRRYLTDMATPGSGIEYEDKGYSVALHYRNAPKQAERLRQHVAAGRAAFPKEATELLLGKAMFEVKRPGISKGKAVAELMTRVPYAGRMPVFIGDDITDDSVFKVLPALGGKGFSVGRYFENVAGTFRAPDDVRQALETLASHKAV